jgi:hypothetical protein
VTFGSAKRDNQDRVVIHGSVRNQAVNKIVKKIWRFGPKTSFERVPIWEIL